MSKLQQLARGEGMTVDALLESATYDSVVPGICMIKGCDYSTGVEPDQMAGWCEECDAGTVRSCLVIAGIL